jgi:hypothetical protein
MRNDTTRKLALGGILLSIGIVLTVTLHLSGLGIGPYLLPMHFIVLLSLFSAGSFGIALAVLMPLFNFMLGLMPPHIALFLGIELLLLSLFTLLSLKMFNRVAKKSRWVAHALIAGSIVITKSVLIGAVFLAIEANLVVFLGAPAAYVATSTITGLGGLILCVVAVPIVHERVLIRKANFEEEHRDER